jgi:hypothetical protein
MPVKSYSEATVRRIAIAIAVVALVGLMFIALYYTVGGPFGTLNDIFVALESVLSIVLMLALFPLHRALAPRLSGFSLAIGVVGCILGPIGSGLVMSDQTGWFLAGLVATFGYACVGIWLLLFSCSVLHSPGFPRGLARLGIIAGSIAGVGLLAGPAILAGTDAMDSAGWPALAGLFIGGMGWNILYHLWRLLLGRRRLSNS